MAAAICSRRLGIIGIVVRLYGPSEIGVSGLRQLPDLLSASVRAVSASIRVSRGSLGFSRSVVRRTVVPVRLVSSMTYYSVSRIAIAIQLIASAASVAM